MAKYVAAVCLFTVMGIAISIIDARSSDVIGSRAPVDARPDTTSTIYATGIVEGATQDIHLRAEQFGRVREVLVTAGQWVEAGDVLVRLDGDRQQQEVALASARLELAKAELERLRNGARAEEREEGHALVRAAQARVDQAIRSLKRIQQLQSDRAVTQQEADDQLSLVDTTRAELEAAQARVRQIEAPARTDELRASEARVAAAQAEFNLANIGLSKTVLQAPRRGCVLDIHAEPGELTGPDAPLPVVVLSDTSTVRVRAFVEELDAPRVRVGMAAIITADGLADQKLFGVIVNVSPRVVSKQLRTAAPNELYDVMNREVLIDVRQAVPLPVGLRVDVMLEGSPSGQNGKS